MLKISFVVIMMTCIADMTSSFVPSSLSSSTTRRVKLTSSQQRREEKSIYTERLFLAKNDDTTTRRQLARSTGSSESNNSQVVVGSAMSISAATLNPIETWFVIHMDAWYSKSLSIKCPFMRRRMADMLDGIDMIMRFLIIRHKSLDLIGPPPGCRSTRMSKLKHRHMSIEERLQTIEQDWKVNTNKGYYITGRLNTTIYRDDCLFDGPDPDMPVRGLRKYLNAASQLFDHTSSQAELLSLEIVQDAVEEEKGYASTTIKENNVAVNHIIGDDVTAPATTPAAMMFKPVQQRDDSIEQQTKIVATWRLQGVLHLPWHPVLPVWTGRTTYHFDENGLIYLHKEEWDIPVVQAFLQTLWPEAANLVWSTKSTSPIKQDTKQTNKKN